MIEITPKLAQGILTMMMRGRTNTQIADHFNLDTETVRAVVDGDCEYIDGSYLNTRDDSDDDDGYEYWPSQQCWAWPCDKNGTIIKDKYGDEREISKSVDHFIKPDEWITTFLKYKLIH